MITPPLDGHDVTQFRFRASNAHNRDMLEYHAERAALTGDMALAAAFTQAAGLYAICEALFGRETAA